MLTEMELHLLNDFQHNFPLVPEPFDEIARSLGSDTTTLWRAFERLLGDGVISRIGATFRPNRVGASTLAALAVAPEQMESVARLVSAYPEVNHNYEREHTYNLWFVIAASDRERVTTVLHEIETKVSQRALYLPMIEDYHIDLGFDLLGKSKRSPTNQYRPATTRRPRQPPDPLLIAALQAGIPTVRRPYLEIARRAGMTEEQVIHHLRDLVEAGDIKRLGVIVRHHELGFLANAMVVWEVPDERIAALGHSIAERDFVTLCYRRQRDLPAWPYNLYCMVHGRDRSKVESALACLQDECGLRGYDHRVLFSLRRFKQCGARYSTATEAA
ncbi:MAG: siroheme decarboxylase subunit beta [Sulfuriferula sp.]